MQLNKNFVRKLEEALDTSSFSSEDFDFSFPSSDVLVVITFLHHDSFQLVIKEIEYEKEVKVSKPIQTDIFVASWRKPKGDETEYTTEQIKTFEISMSPGELKSTDCYHEDDLSRMEYSLGSWCKYIEQELLVLYAEEVIYDQDLSTQIDEMFPDEIENSEDRFTSLEIDELANNLDMLYDRISKIRQECDLSEEKLKELKIALKKAQNNARVYPKGAWLKFNKAKISKSLKKVLSVPEVRQLGFEVIKKIVLS